MSFPIKQQVLNNILAERDLTDVSKTTIRQCAAIAAEMEKAAGEKFLRLEVGVPGLAPGQVGVDAQKAALDNGIASIYPAISGLPELKENASRFIKAFIDVDINPECIVPTVGSMQAGMNLMLECSQLDPKKDTILYVNPGFAPHVMQAQVQGIKHEQFDIYEFRGAKLRDKLEEYCSKGNIVAIVYSNPNNPSWVCLTDEELQIIGDMANKYDMIVLEDHAYMCMDFRTDKSVPFEPPFQPTVARYTDNYVFMLSGSKIFSYAGERIAVVAFSNKLFNREYPALRERYRIGRMGDNFIFTYLYVASSGTSHSAQHALSAMMKAAADGTYKFVDEVREYGRRAKITKAIFLKHGFNIIYDKDGDQDLADGFYYTIGYEGMSDSELLNDLMLCGISAITLNTTGSKQPGIRACVSQLNSEWHIQALDERLKLFVELQNSKK
jgi:aspartate/methionine/tyrosine aminotransferase